MEAKKLWLLRDFIKADKVLFKIPVYQRNYDWAEKHCNRLLGDIEQIIKTGEKHFLGAIVHLGETNGVSLREHIIIDGQQRLTTMMLLLKALEDISRKEDPSCAEEIDITCIHNQYCEAELKIKLKPIKTDNKQFQLLLNGKLEDMDPSSHIYKNYQLCKERMESWVKKGLQPRQILEALSMLEVVEIALTKGEDDPQIIFESINSTGLDLSNADLIRNFLLMDAQNQEELFETYWLPLEKMLKPGADYKNLELFFMQYIIYKTASKVDKRSLYDDFVHLYKEGDFTPDTILQELKYCASIFQAFIYDNSRYSAPIQKELQNLRLLKQTTCYPFLLHVFNDFEQHVITEQTLLETLRLIVAYLVRRLVCGVPSNSLRNLFTSLYHRVFKIQENKTKYYASINKFLFSRTNKDRIPTDSEFIQQLQITNLYSNLPLCRLLLMSIENGQGKEILSAANLTVEHIMPQKLNADWKHISNEEHETNLPVLGNLSVTGYNGELSNKSFEEKKNIIREYSKAVILNKDVLNQPVWNVEAIHTRGKRLAEILKNYFAIQPVQDAGIEFECLAPITLAQIDEITGKKPDSFCFQGRRYTQDTYISILFEMLKLLDEQKPGTLEKLAHSKFQFKGTRTWHPHITTDPQELTKSYEVKPGIFVETKISSRDILRFIKALLEAYQIEQNAFSINILAEEEDVYEEEAEDEEA